MSEFLGMGNLFAHLSDGKPSACVLIALLPRFFQHIGGSKMRQMHLSGGLLKCGFLLSALCLLSASASALTIDTSYTGTLTTPEDVFETPFTLTADGTVTIQTWGFGGGTNGADQTIAAGGFDPLIALFSGTGPSAAIVTDGLGNPLADADNLSNFPWSYVGNCPPAGTVAIGAGNDCGDDFMQTTLAAGTYTLLLTDANYLPDAIFDNGTLSEGFTDFTGGVFQTCDPESQACITTNGNYAVDVITPGESPVVTPEPSPLSLLGVGLLGLAGLSQINKWRMSPHSKGASA
jgi:hypothetical protein